jgi:outer membrane receptor protein involved in Fe transport
MRVTLAATVQAVKSGPPASALRLPAAAIANTQRNIAYGIAAGIIAFGLLLCDSARAQQATPSEGPPASDKLQEVVVTALKREQRLQDVPVSISTLSSETLDKLNAEDFSKVADSVPGVAYATTGVGNSQYIIRGIGSVGAVQSPTTGVYLDETPLQARSLRGSSQPDPQLYDISRIEILRGPQGVLYGSSTMGGLVRIVTNQPDTKATAANVEAGAAAIQDGSESWDIKSMVNVPIVNDVLALRVAASFIHEGGWIDDLRPKTADLTENIIGNPSAIRRDDNWSRYPTIRAALRWEAAPTLTITPSFIYQDAYSNTDRTFSDETFGLRARTKARYMDTYAKDKFGIGNVLVQWDVNALGGVSLLSSSSYMDRRTHLFFDVTAYYSPSVEAIVGPGPDGQLYPTPLQDISHTKQFTQEIRMVSNNSSRVQYIVGGLFRKMDVDFERTITATNLFGATAPPPLGLTNPPILDDEYTAFTETEVAGFGEVTYAFTEHFKVGAGVRVFSYKQHEDGSQYGIGGVAGGDQGYNYSEPNKESGATPRLTLNYEPSRAASFYASYSQGFRTGGVNPPIPDNVCTPAERQAAGLPDVPPPYKSDKTDNYELGTKSELFNGKLSINASVFWINWLDYQQAIQTTCGVNNEKVVSYIANAGKVLSKGGELEVAYIPVEGLTLQAGGAYINATYREPVPELALPAGSRVLDVPKITWNAKADYAFPISGTLNADLFFSARHVGASDSGFGEGTLLPRPAYTLLDLSAGLTTASKLTLQLYVNNLTDAIPVYGAEYATSPDTTTATSYFADEVGPPRTIGVRVSKAF